jgi:hypothetical protein
MPKKFAPDYIRKIPGIRHFALVPTQAIIDPDIRKRQLLVLCVLCLHAGEGAAVNVSQARIAELLGYTESLVSRLISNPDYLKTGDRIGPGLVQLGYVHNAGQRTRTSTNDYELKTLEITDGNVTRPDGSVTRLGTVISHQVSDAEHARNRRELAEKQAESRRKAEDKFKTIPLPEPTSAPSFKPQVAESIVSNPGKLVYSPQTYIDYGFAVPGAPAPVQAPEQVPEVLEVPPEVLPALEQPVGPAPAPFALVPDAEMLEIDGREYTKDDVLRDIEDFHEGFDFCVPVDAYYHFGYQRPGRRDSQY